MYEGVLDRIDDEEESDNKKSNDQVDARELKVGGANVWRRKAWHGMLRQGNIHIDQKPSYFDNINTRLQSIRT